MDVLRWWAAERVSYLGEHGEDWNGEQRLDS